MFMNFVHFQFKVLKIVRIYFLLSINSTTNNLDAVEVLVGTNKLNSTRGTRYKVKEVIKHEEFFVPESDDVLDNYTYDIAVIRVAPIQFNDKVQPIKYSIEEVKAGENLQATGWGYLQVFFPFFPNFFSSASIIIGVKYCQFSARRPATKSLASAKRKINHQ